MIDVDEQLEVIEHLDFQIPCSIRTAMFLHIAGVALPMEVPNVCPEPAVAIVRCRVCSRAGYICAGHRSRLVAEPRVTCHACDASGAPLLMFEFNPLPSGGV